MGKNGNRSESSLDLYPSLLSSAAGAKLSDVSKREIVRLSGFSGLQNKSRPKGFLQKIVYFADLPAASLAHADGPGSS